MAKIIPAILADNIVEFKKQWAKVSPYFPYLQIDIMDGKLVKTKNNIDPKKIKILTKNKNLEVHLMVKDVLKYLTAWSPLKNVKKIIWHYEAGKININQYLKILRNKKIKAGLAFNPSTKLSTLEPLVKKLDTIMVMGVIPGKMGQKFQPLALKKIKALRKKYPRLNIEVDGGVNDKNFSGIKKAGANLIAIGSYLQQSPDLKNSLKKLK